MTSTEATTPVEVTDEQWRSLLKSVTKPKKGQDKAAWVESANAIIGQMQMLCFYMGEGVLEKALEEISNMAQGIEEEPIALLDLRNRLPRKIWNILHEYLGNINGEVWARIDQRELAAFNSDKGDNNFPFDLETYDASAQANAYKLRVEKARIQEVASAKESSMGISEEQNKSAKPESYIQPSRVGKKRFSLYLDDETMARVRALAHETNRPVHEVIEHAVTRLLEGRQSEVEAGLTHLRNPSVL